MHFEFATATRIIFGAGSLAQTGSTSKTFGRRALVVTGRNPRRAEKLMADLPANGIRTASFVVASEPEISTIEQGAAFAKNEQCDFVIGIGGGSVIDAGKAIAAMLADSGEVLDYVEIIGRGKALTNPSAPCIAIPTTAGTGS